MSYSFSVTSNSKKEARGAIALELAKVVESQPQHATDRHAVQNAADSFVSMLRDPGDGEVIGVNVSGSLSWGENSAVFSGANVSVSAWVGPKPA